MTHEIFGERFIGARTPAWHNLGTVFTDAPTMTEALVRAKITYAVKKIPLLGGWSMPDGTVKLVDPGVVALVREPTADDPEPRSLGTASNDFTVVQNHELAELLDPLSKEWPVETAGALREGAITFMTLDVGKFAVAGDECAQYLLVSNGFDGTRSLEVRQTGIRVVCANTLAMAEGKSSVAFKLRHIGDVKREAEWYINLIAELRTGMKAAQERLAALGEAKVTHDEVKAIIDAAYLMPKTPQKLTVTNAASSEAMNKELVKRLLEDTKGDVHKHQVDRDRAQMLRQAGYEMYEKLSDEFDRIAGTAWAAYNAVTETSTWREGPNADESVMLGVRADEIGRAYDKAMTLVNA